MPPALPPAARPPTDPVGGPSRALAQPTAAHTDDAVLLGHLRELNDEHEAMLATWEEDLRRREERLRAAIERRGGTAAA